MHASPKLRTKLQKAESRGEYNICAETAAAAHAIGHEQLGSSSVLLKGKKWSMQHVPHNPNAPFPNNEFIPLERVPERRHAFIKQVKKLGRSGGRFMGSTLVTLADPCASCTHVLIDIGVSEVIADAQSHCVTMSDWRMKQMREAAKRLHHHDVQHRYVHYHLNI